MIGVEMVDEDGKPLPVQRSGDVFEAIKVGAMGDMLFYF